MNVEICHIVPLYVLQPGPEWSGLHLGEHVLANRTKPGDVVVATFEARVRETWDVAPDQRRTLLSTSVRAYEAPAGLDEARDDYPVWLEVAEVATAHGPKYTQIRWAPGDNTVSLAARCDHGEAWEAA